MLVLDPVGRAFNLKCCIFLKRRITYIFLGLFQVVVGSFLPSGHLDQKTKKPKSDYATATFTQAIAVSAAPPPPQTNNAEKEDAMGGGGGHVLQSSGTLNSNFTSPPPTAFRRENWVNMHSMPDTRKAATDINISLPDN